MQRLLSGLRPDQCAQNAGAPRASSVGPEHRARGAYIPKPSELESELPDRKYPAERTAAASGLRLSATMQLPRRAPRSLSFGVFGVATRWP